VPRLQVRAPAAPNRGARSPPACDSTGSPTFPIRPLGSRLETPGATQSKPRRTDECEIGATDWGRDLTFATVTGSVDVEIPAASNAEVDASVVTGTVTSDFPLTEASPGRYEGTIGDGGPTLSLSTVTGTVRLRRGT
jgi:hypothetical protein